MKKDTFYFPHDSNAQHDPKCAALIHDFGMEGYGLYWMVIELLHQQAGGKLEKFPKLFDGIAHDFMVKKDLIVKLFEALLHDYILLQEDEKYIWSDRVLRNLDIREEKRVIKAEAGRIGGIKSGISRSKKQDLNNPKQDEAVLQKWKQSKEKERKKSIITNTDSFAKNGKIHADEVPDYTDTTKWAKNLIGEGYSRLLTPEERKKAEDEWEDKK